MHTNEMVKKARLLRKEGYSYGYISQELAISKSTASLWLKDYPFTPNEITRQAMMSGRIAAIRSRQNNKMLEITRATLYAKSSIGKITKRDLFMLGLGLYIGEGSKSKGVLRIVNSDPRVICLAKEWFMSVFDADRSRFSIAIHLYPDHDISSVLAFWSKTIKIPVSQFGKTQIDRRLDKREKKNTKLPYGTAHLTFRGNGQKIYDTPLVKIISAWQEEVLNKKLRD